MPTSSPPGADYGPPGYLPERASRRARKIVLREQMGLGWPLAAVVAGVLLAGVGAVFLATRTGPPQPPFAGVAPIEAVDPRGAAAFDLETGESVVLVRAGGGVRAFAAPDEAIIHCRASGRLEAVDGSVWNLNGRLVAGSGASLEPLPAEVHAGVVYVDPTAPRPAAPPQPSGERPTCLDGE